jgi:hypothetical protein
MVGYLADVILKCWILMSLCFLLEQTIFFYPILLNSNIVCVFIPDNLLSSVISFVKIVSIIMLSGFTRVATLMTPLKLSPFCYGYSAVL